MCNLDLSHLRLVNQSTFAKTILACWEQMCQTTQVKPRFAKGIHYIVPTLLLLTSITRMCAAFRRI